MNWEQTKDNMNSFLGAAILFLPLYYEFRKSKDQKRWWRIVLYAIIITLLLLLGCDKIKRDNRKDTANEHKTEHLQKGINDLKEARSIDSVVRDKQFKELKDKFGISVDSNGNFIKTQINIEKNGVINMY